MTGLRSLSGLLLVSALLGIVPTCLSQPPTIATFQSWRPEKIINVCSASFDMFGSLCNQNPDQKLPMEVGGNCEPSSLKFAEDSKVKNGINIPANISTKRNFCGYTLDIWWNVANDLGLIEGIHYKHYCGGPKFFKPMLAALGYNDTTSQCDIGVGTITANEERKKQGIQFSSAMHKGSVMALTYSPKRNIDMWAFMKPLRPTVWLALLGTIFLVPIFIFAFEYLFSERNQAYRPLSAEGRRRIGIGMKDALWHSMAHVLSIEYFHVYTISGRILAAAYAFLVLIVTSTYTANLAAFLTADQLSTSIETLDDLRGKAVATVPTYEEALFDEQSIVASVAPDKFGWDLRIMLSKMRHGDVAAIALDDTVVENIMYTDPNCAYRLVEGRVINFNLGIAFKHDFARRDLIQNISARLDQYQDDGLLDKLKVAWTGEDTSSCAQQDVNQAVSRVGISSLFGLWLILGGAFLVASLIAVARWLSRRRKPTQRARELARWMTPAARHPQVTEALDGTHTQGSPQSANELSSSPPLTSTSLTLPDFAASTDDTHSSAGSGASAMRIPALQTRYYPDGYSTSVCRIGMD